MSVVEEAAPPPPKRRLKLVLTLVALGLVLFFLVRYIGDHWDRIKDHNWTFDPSLLAGSAALLVISLIMTADGWRRALKLLGGHIPAADSWFVWGIGQTGKYIPGMVWPLAAKVALTRRHNIPMKTVAVSGIIELIMTVGMAISLSVITLDLQRGDWSYLHRPILGPLKAQHLGLIVVGMGVLLLLPKPFGAIARTIAGAAKLEPYPEKLTSGRVALLCVWYLLAWTVHAFAMALFCAATLPALGYGDWPALAAAYVASFISGFLVVFLPMGLGVQDAAFAILAGSLFPEPAVAVVVCLATRLWLGLGELGTLGLAAALRRKTSV